LSETSKNGLYQVL